MAQKSKFIKLYLLSSRMKPNHPKKDSCRLKPTTGREKEVDLFAAQPGYLNVTTTHQVSSSNFKNREKKKEPLKHEEYFIENKNKQKTVKNNHPTEKRINKVEQKRISKEQQVAVCKIRQMRSNQFEKLHQSKPILIQHIQQSSKSIKVFQKQNSHQKKKPYPIVKSKSIDTYQAKKLTQEDIRNHRTCFICKNDMKNIVTLVNLSCTHRFHRRCILSRITEDSRCPICNKEYRNEVFHEL